MELPKAFLRYAALFEEKGFSLYMIGGTSRDILLGLVPEDFDFVTDATPSDMRLIIPNADYSFEKYGSVKVKEGKEEFDFTTFRIEREYIDFRHPSFVSFTKDMREDSYRRDFTINALYINKDGKVFDFHKGLDDLKNKTIRFIGDPSKRVNEDPLRIIRAERFASRLGFSLEDKTKKAISDNYALLEKLNAEKVKMERKKK